MQQECMNDNTGVNIDMASLQQLATNLTRMGHLPPCAPPMKSAIAATS
jgi:hypothetical protein